MSKGLTVCSTCSGFDSQDGYPYKHLQNQRKPMTLDLRMEDMSKF